MNNKIGIIGTGKLGLSFALLCEQNGYEVMGLDTRTNYVRQLNDKSFKTIEPHIEEYLKSSTKFKATVTPKEVFDFADILFVFVPTPSLQSGAYDHQSIEHTIDDLIKLGITNKILVIGCTTMPGYVDTVSERLSKYNIKVAYNPEFIAQGEIINGLKYADMVLIGTEHSDVYYKLKNIYKSIMTHTPVVHVMSPMAAEITKIGINCFLANKIAYANMIGEIAVNSGIGHEVDTILRAIGSDSRIGNKFFKYGFGYSGPCIPRDGRALGIYMESVAIPAKLPVIVDTINKEHLKFLRLYYMRMNPDKNIPFVFPHLCYKKGTNILTDSQPYELFKMLLEEGYTIDVSESEQVIAEIKSKYGEHTQRITYGTCKEGHKIEF